MAQQVNLFEHANATIYCFNKKFFYTCFMILSIVRIIFGIFCISKIKHFSFYDRVIHLDMGDKLKQCNIQSNFQCGRRTTKITTNFHLKLLLYSYVRT